MPLAMRSDLIKSIGIIMVLRLHLRGQSSSGLWTKWSPSDCHYVGHY